MFSGGDENGKRPAATDAPDAVADASSGIGRATAHAFAKRGASVVLAAQRAGMLEEAARECEALAAVSACPDVQPASADGQERNRTGRAIP